MPRKYKTLALIAGGALTLAVLVNVASLTLLVPMGRLLVPLWALLLFSIAVFSCIGLGITILVIVTVYRDAPDRAAVTREDRSEAA